MLYCIYVKLFCYSIKHPGNPPPNFRPKTMHSYIIVHTCVVYVLRWGWLVGICTNLVGELLIAS